MAEATVPLRHALEALIGAGQHEAAASLALRAAKREAKNPTAASAAAGVTADELAKPPVERGYLTHAELKQATLEQMTRCSPTRRGCRRDNPQDSTTNHRARGTRRERHGRDQRRPPARGTPRADRAHRSARTRTVTGRRRAAPTPGRPATGEINALLSRIIETHAAGARDGKRGDVGGLEQRIAHLVAGEEQLALLATVAADVEAHRRKLSELVRLAVSGLADADDRRALVATFVPWSVPRDPDTGGIATRHAHLQAYWECVSRVTSGRQLVSFSSDEEATQWQTVDEIAASRSR